MLPVIGQLVFHSQLIDISARVSEELQGEVAGIEVACPPPQDEAAIIVAVERLAERCDVLITRGDTVNFLSSHLRIPVIARSIALSDILDALSLIREKAKLVALVVHHTQDFDLGSWPSILGVQVKKFVYQFRREVEHAVLRAQQERYDGVVGGVLAGHYASLLGIQYELIGIRKETVLQSVRKAIDVYKAIQREKDYASRFQSLLDFAHEGIIFLEDTDLLIYLNRRACQILQINEQALLRKRLLDLLPAFIEEKSMEPIRKALGDSDQEPTPTLGLLVSLKKGPNVVVSINRASLEEGKTRTVITFTEAVELEKVEHKVRQQLAARGLSSRFSFDDIIGRSPALERVKEQARSFARTESTVLLYGETGTGKEIFAHSIHRLSLRASGPFVALNCSAMPKELMESELFGYEEGAFTGAKKTGKPGLFEIAHGGTLFLDEIGTMSLDLQARLLRVIQGKEVVRLGGTKLIPISVRIIAATNRNLDLAIQNGEFREDLYYRLNVLLLRIPPLRQRPEDIPLLFECFVKKFASQTHAPALVPNAKELGELNTYSWPGNVRELENLAERYVAVAAYRRSTAGLLEELLNEMKYGSTSTSGKTNGLLRGHTKWFSDSYTAIVQATERELLVSVGEKVNWNRAKMAQELGVSLSTLWRKMRKTGLIQPKVLQNSGEPKSCR